MEGHKDQVTLLSTVPSPERTLSKHQLPQHPHSAQSWDKCLLGHWAGGITRPGPDRGSSPSLPWTLYWALGLGLPYTRKGCTFCAVLTGLRWEP